MAYKILLVDDHQFIVDSLKMLSRTMPTMEVAGTCMNGKEAMAFLQKNRVDIVLSDLRMPEMDGIELATEIQQYYPYVKIMLLTISDAPDTIRNALRAGVSGYLLKKAGIDEIRLAIETVVNGGKYFSDQVLFEISKNADNQSFTLILSRRELEVIRLISDEITTTEIAEKLFISESTVETHRRNILQKMGVKNSVGMVKYAMQHQLI